MAVNNDVENLMAVLKPGSHLCSIYRNQHEQFALLIPFIKGALLNREMCVYIVDENTKEEVGAILQSKGLKLGIGEREGQIKFLTKNDTYLKEGHFSPEKMLALNREVQEMALAHEYTGVRGTGEMTWALRRFPGSQMLIEYEAKLGEFLPTSRITAICQYNESQFTARVLANILYTHPIVGLYGKLYDNPYYVQPSVFLNTPDQSGWRPYGQMRDALLKSQPKQSWEAQ